MPFWLNQYALLIEFESHYYLRLHNCLKLGEQTFLSFSLKSIWGWDKNVQSFFLGTNHTYLRTKLVDKPRDKYTDEATDKKPIDMVNYRISCAAYTLALVSHEKCSLEHSLLKQLLSTVHLRQDSNPRVSIYQCCIHTGWFLIKGCSPINCTYQVSHL